MANRSIENPLLPATLSVAEIRERLEQIFPSEFPNRKTLVGLMAARVIFVFLYGGFIEGYGRHLRPSYIYLFTENQERKLRNEDRLNWIKSIALKGHRLPGKRWYADTTREPIRDDLMRNQLLRLGIMQKVPGVPITASRPVYFLTRDFAGLFDPQLKGEELVDIKKWSDVHLDMATRQRMALRAQGIQAQEGDLLVNMPDGTRIRITAGPSSLIAKGLIEEFAKRHLDSPAVLWLSASDKKSYPQFAELSASVGLKFDLSTELPDIVLADMKDQVKFLFCEIVATDGAVTESRRESLLAIVRESEIPEEAVNFLSAFEDRESSAFRKNFAQLALNSLVWFRTEPNLLVVLSSKV